VIFPLFQGRRAFVKAGLDPNNPPKTLDKITEAARKLTKATQGCLLGVMPQVRRS
jgi:sn-glycerol 3-phosphate transport system substrate-binding protein